MKKYFLLFALLSISLFPQSVNYFPISIGNKYQFASDYNEYFSEGIIEKDSTFQNGKKYFYYPFESFFTDYVRVDSSGNIYSPNINPLNSEEMFVFNASIKKDETWQINKDTSEQTLNYYGKCTLDTIKNILGKDRNVKEIQILDNNMNATTRYFTLVEDIGLFYFVEGVDAGRKALVYADIDGTEYGNYYNTRNHIFFPLSIGNEYQFKQVTTNKYIYGKIVKDTIYSNNLRYFSFPKSIIEFGDIRYDSTGYLWSISQPFVSSDSIQEYLLFNYYYGPSWFNYWSVAEKAGTSKEKLLGYNSSSLITNFLGKDIWLKDIEIFQKVNGNSTGYINFTLGQDLGIVKFKYPGQDEWILNYANINGVQYGELVDVNENTQVVNNYSLSQNYPNPFNPSTTIRYSIKERSRVTIKIYNSLGAEVETLVNEFKPSGSFEIKFNASQLPSGVYFYRINAGNFFETKKMIIMK